MVKRSEQPFPWKRAVLGWLTAIPAAALATIVIHAGADPIAVFLVALFFWFYPVLVWVFFARQK